MDTIPSDIAASFDVRAETYSGISYMCDVEMAWESNLLSAAHEAVRTMESDSLARMRVAFETALTMAERRAPGSTAMAELLFAKGIR